MGFLFVLDLPFRSASRRGNVFFEISRRHSTVKLVSLKLHYCIYLVCYIKTVFIDFENLRQKKLLFRFCLKLFPDICLDGDEIKNINREILSGFRELRHIIHG